MHMLAVELLTNVSIMAWMRDLQVAQVCVAALNGDAQLYSRRVIEVVARPDVPAGTMRVLVDQ